jgi:hypothetical protein
MNYSPEMAAVLHWFVLGQWLMLGLVFCIDSWRGFFRANLMYQKAQEWDGGGLLDIAGTRRAKQVWYIIGSHLAFFLGLLSLYQIFFLAPAPPETRVFNSVIREGVVFMFFAFWRTERLLIVLYARQDEAMMRKDAAIARKDEAIERLEEQHDGDELARDTNIRVQEMQERGQHDQPEEEADREAGRNHRNQEQ